MSPLFGAVVLLFACGVQSAVIELDDNSFYNYAKDRDVLLVDFYAPWCSDCKNLEPDFQAAGVSLGARSIDLAKVDCFGAGKGLCNSFGIKEWPTLKNFNRGKYTGDYTGGLTAGEIAGYVNTVENSANPQAVSNPYASPYQPMAIATQQCVSRCKISKITNKAPCYAKCKSPKPAGRKMLPQPVINEKSCAKCRQPLIAGKFRHLCSRSVERACNQLFMKDADYWKKFTNKPRFQPSIAPDLFEPHRENAMITHLVVHKPLMNAYARASPQMRKYQRLQVNPLAQRPNNILKAFGKLPSAQQLKRPWSAVMADVHAKDVLRPQFISPHRGADAMLSFTKMNKETETAGVAGDDLLGKLPETKVAVKLPVQGAAWVSPATKIPDSPKANMVEPQKADIADVSSKPTEVTNLKANTTESAHAPQSEEHPKDEKSYEENAQAKKNINNELSSISSDGSKIATALGDATKNITNAIGDNANKVTSTIGDNASKVKTALEDTANKVKASTDELTNGSAIESNNPQSSSAVVSENPQKYANATTADTADTRDTEQPKEWNNETIAAVDTSSSSAKEPLTNKVPDTITTGILSGFGTPVSNASTISVSVEKLNNGGDTRSVDKPMNNTPLENNASNNTNLTTGSDVGKRDEQLTAVDEKSILRNVTTSLKEMNLIESEINHGAAEVNAQPQLPENGIAEERNPGRSKFPGATEQLDTIDSIESQFKNGELNSETSQLKVSGSELDTLPSDVVAKLPYTRDDKKETIPMQEDILDQQDVDVFTRNRY